jgi:putative addiction module component (TIGR02574 family)
MSKTAAALLSAALQLPDDERLSLATELIASVDGPADADWDEAWLAELDRRAEASRMRGESGADWAAVRASLLARIAGT